MILKACFVLLSLDFHQLLDLGHHLPILLLIFMCCQGIGQSSIIQRIKPYIDVHILQKHNLYVAKYQYLPHTPTKQNASKLFNTFALHHYHYLVICNHKHKWLLFPLQMIQLLSCLLQKCQILLDQKYPQFDQLTRITGEKEYGGSIYNQPHQRSILWQRRDKNMPLLFNQINQQLYNLHLIMVCNVLKQLPFTFNLWHRYIYYTKSYILNLLLYKRNYQLNLFILVSVQAFPWYL